MSHHASSWAVEQTPRTTDGKLDAYGKLVLLVLGDLAGTDGVLWHGSKAIAEIACMPPETARKVLARLEAGRFLQRVERYRNDGSRTTSVLVLAPDGVRGSMTDPTGNKQFGGEIAAALAGVAERHPPVTERPDPVTEPPTPVTQRYGGSEPVIEPVSEPVVTARERAKNLDPSRVRDLIAAIDQEAEREDLPDRSFIAHWVRGDRDRVAAMLERELPPVRLELTLWLLDQVAAGWSGKSIAAGLAGKPLQVARAQAAAKTTAPRERPLSPKAQANARRMAIIRGETPPGPPAPSYDYEAQGVLGTS